MNPMVTCERCEGKFPPELLTEFDGAALCPECLTGLHPTLFALWRAHLAGRE